MERSARFVLETFHDGGILLDLEGGVLLSLNSSATFVWTRALEGDDDERIAADFAGTFNVSTDVARTDVAAALSSRPEAAAISPPQTETHYELLGDRYRFSVLGVPVLEVFTSGLSLKLLRHLTPRELYFHLKAVSPKLVALSGTPVLHAAAVQDQNGLVTAFLGESGAGKTTTARAFSAAGLTLICEDKLVLRRRDEEIVAVIGGETRIDRWVREMGTRLAAAEIGQWCDITPLHEVDAGPVAAFGAAVVLDPGRRTGSEIHFEPIGPAKTAGHLFQHAFYGSFAFTEWSRYVGVAALLARSTPGYVATVPNGGDQLTEAARRYTERTQS